MYLILFPGTNPIMVIIAMKSITNVSINTIKILGNWLLVIFQLDLIALKGLAEASVIIKPVK